MKQPSNENLRLRAVSQFRQAGKFAAKEPEPDVIPIPVQQRAESDLWGRLPTQAMINLREMPDKTARVYSSLCSLLQGSAGIIQVAEIAYLAKLKDRSTREHLKRLREAGLIESKASRHGPSIYWLVTPCASKECREVPPDRLGSEFTPNKDQKFKIKPLTPEGEGTGNQKEEKNTSKDESSENTLDEYLDSRENHQEQTKKFEETCQQVKQELEVNQTEKAKTEAVEKAISDGQIPRWWVELLILLPLSPVSRSVLQQAVPREITTNSISIGLNSSLADYLKMRQASLDAALSQAQKSKFSLLIGGEKSANETSIADIYEQISSEKIDFAQIQRVALERLGWEAAPEFKPLECIERYGDQAENVIELAKKAGGGGSLELLDKWMDYPVSAIMRLVDFEKEKSEVDPVQNHSRWWKPTLCGIMEKQKEESLRRISA